MAVGSVAAALLLAVAGLAWDGYAFAAASVITTAKRSFSVLASIISGNAVFKEKGLGVKLTAFFLTVAGLVCLAAGAR